MAIEKVSPNREKARSLHKMALSTFSMVKTIDAEKYPSNVLKEYYDSIRQLVDIHLLLRGYKSYGEGAHEKCLALAYQQEVLTTTEHFLAKELRKMRNRVAYEGFFVEYDYLKRKEKDIKALIEKLIKSAEKQLSSDSPETF